MQLTHVYCKATGAYAHVPSKSAGTWARHGWVAVSDLPDEDEVSAAEAEKTADRTADHTSRGKPSARTAKDK